MQGKWSELFLQRPPLCSHSSWLWAGLYVCQLALKRVPHMHSHAHVMNLWIMLSCLFHSSYTAASWFLHTQRGNILYHNYGINAAEKGFGGGGGAVVGDKLRREKEHRKGSGLLFYVKRKRVHSNQNEGLIWFAITSQMISRCLKLIGFLESVGGESSRGALTPADLKASAAWPGIPGCALMCISHAIHPCQTSDNRCRFLLAPSTRRPLTRPPHVAEDAEKHAMLNGWSNTHKQKHECTQAHMDVVKQKKSHTCVRGKSLHRLKHTSNRPILIKTP